MFPSVLTVCESPLTRPRLFLPRNAQHVTGASWRLELVRAVVALGGIAAWALAAVLFAS